MGEGGVNLSRRLVRSKKGTYLEPGGSKPEQEEEDTKNGSLLDLRVSLNETEGDDKHRNSLSDGSSQEHVSSSNSLDGVVRKESRESVDCDGNSTENE